jgi:hypothetical protein
VKSANSGLYKSTFAMLSQKIMIRNVNCIIKVELPGLEKLILNTTSDIYIREYVKILTKCQYPDDERIMLILSNKLLDWYKGKIGAIQKNKYMYDKNQHEKSIEILESLIQMIQEGGE